MINYDDNFPYTSGLSFANELASRFKALKDTLNNGAFSAPGVLKYRLAWDAATAYVAYDVVSSGGGKWIARANSTNSAPVEGADWTALGGGGNGAPGPKGDKGDKGDKGTTGDVGPIGPQGPAGANGADGQNGAVGPKGDKGDVGAQGPAGADGSDGADGAVGPQGPANGPVGPQGPQGEAGPQGPAGTNGAVGPKGDKGDAGAQGPQGVAGTNGSGINAESIRGVNVAATAPANGQALVFNGTDWAPGNVAASGGGSSDARDGWLFN